MLAQEDIGLNEINISFTLLSSIMLIGLTGRNASGKSTLVNWFAEKGLRSVSCSDSIREWLKNQNKEINRDSLIEGGRSLRKKGGVNRLAPNPIPPWVFVANDIILITRCSPSLP